MFTRMLNGVRNGELGFRGIASEHDMGKMNCAFDKKRIWARGLLVECPFKTPLEDCPLKEVRELSIKQRIAKVDEMSDADLDTVLSHHWECQAKRENKK